jgi:hypothetical protein
MLVRSDEKISQRVENMGNKSGPSGALQKRSAGIRWRAMAIGHDWRYEPKTRSLSLVFLNSVIECLLKLWINQQKKWLKTIPIGMFCPNHHVIRSRTIFKISADWPLARSRRGYSGPLDRRPFLIGGLCDRNHAKRQEQRPRLYRDGGFFNIIMIAIVKCRQRMTSLANKVNHCICRKPFPLGKFFGGSNLWFKIIQKYGSVDVYTYVYIRICYPSSSFGLFSN